MVQWIIALYRNKEKYGKLSNGSEEVTKTRNDPLCPYRLMNTLFSDRFAKQCTQLGNVTDNVLIDTEMQVTINYSGRAFKKCLQDSIWEGVQKVFA